MQKYVTLLDYKDIPKTFTARICGVDDELKNMGDNPKKATGT